MTTLHELSIEECWELAGTAPLARIAWNASDGPVALPVNFVVHERTIWVRTTAHSSMAAEVDDTQIAVEIDEIDAETHEGWSVLMRGSGSVLYHEDEVPEPVRALRTWPTGPRPLWVRLAPAHVTGRRLA
jgi:uncharacterized protein